MGNMLQLISEYEDFLLYHKPAGMDFHSDQGIPGFFRKVQESRPELPLFPVHRLDKVTSGLILLAKSRESAAGLSGLFQQGGVEKYYLALSDKKPARKQGMVKGDMIRSRRGSWKLSRSQNRPAVTCFYSRSIVPGKRAFLVRIYSGKTHQIRVAMKSLGSPVLGDPLYYASGPEVDRTYLHAWQLRFFWNDQLYCFRRDPEEGRFFLPDEGFRLPEEWDRPWEFSWPGGRSVNFQQR